MNSSFTENPDVRIETSSIEAIIFDFDGTLVDSEPVWKSTFFDLFKQEYGVEVPLQILWDNTGGGVDLSVANISNKLELNMSETEIMDTAEKLHEEMQRKILNDLDLREGAAELLEFGRNNNIAMAICTASTNELIDSFFNRLNLRDMFSVVVSTSESEIDKRKPFPFPYLETMRLLDVKPQNSIAVEDSPKGVTSALAAGIETIAIHNPFLDLGKLEVQPKFVVQDFLQVLELFSNE